MGIVFFSSCTNRIEDINALLNKLDIPELEAHEIQVTRTDSGQIVFIAKSPYVQQYDNDMRKYTEFPKGIEVVSFEHYPDTESTMKADYAKFYEDKNLWEAKGNVQAKNSKGEAIATEHLFWDQNKGLIYSSTFTTVTSDVGVFYGKNGFEANDSFKKWKLINSEGVVNVKDE